MKEKLISVDFSPSPIAGVRNLNKADDDELTRDKKKYPFMLNNTVEVFIRTSNLEFSFKIPAGYKWNGADIPKILFVFGQSKDNNYLHASMVHDYLLEQRKWIFRSVLDYKLTADEYRRLTSLVFRQILKDEKTNTIKANIMAWCVDVFQMTVQKKQWECLK